MSSTLSALSPLDGRYAAKVAALRPIFGEAGLMQRRVLVELRWLLALADHPAVPEVAALTAAARANLLAIGTGFTEADAARIISEWRARADASLSDEFGDGEARAYSIACADVRLDEGSSCGDEFSLIFSGLTPGASSGESLGRWMLVVFVHRDEGELRAYRFASGVLGFGLEYPLQGGTGLTFDQNVPRILAPMPEAGAAFVTFFPWDPSALIR